MADNDQSPAESSGESILAGPGAALREARVARGVSVEDVSTELRIEPHLLHALENEDYAALGAPVFAKGYIRQYANRLGLDSVPLVNLYNDAFGHSDVRVQPSRVIKLRDGQQVTVWILALLALALVIVFLFVWWLNEPAATVSDGAVTRTQPAAMPFPGAADEAPASSRTDAGLPARVPAQRVRADGDTATANAEAAVAEAATIAAPQRSDAAVGAASAATGLEAPPEVPAPAVEILFTEDCWAEITDAGGEQLFYGLAEAGSRQALTGRPPFDVFLGNVEGVEIRVNGREFTVPGTARRGNLARFEISPGII
jgi:cytoskeleton protein RodZ